MRLGALLLALGLVAGCRGTLSPLSNRLKIGEEAYLVFTADGEAGKGDLFASAPSGGPPFQITFTRVDERLPALSPDGALLAFLRSGSPGAADTASRAVVVMNLLNGSERVVGVVLGAAPTALAWSPDAAMLYARTPTGVFQSVAPPARGAWNPADPALDSLFQVPVGDPTLGFAGPCAEAARGLCVRLLDGREVALDSAGTMPTRWAGDSVLYQIGDEWTVRPLGGGATRALHWTRPVSHPREPMLFPGPQSRPTPPPG